jgi:plasmid stabilization system protein ParE
MIAYSERAVADLRKISATSRRKFGERVAGELGAHIQATIEHIGREPYSGHELKQKREVYAFPLVQYPFKIFYRVFKGGVRIQHIRNTSRQSWEGE